MQPSNNIFIGSGDPLLGGNANYSIESRLEEINKLKTLLSQKEQNLEQMKTQIPQTQQLSRTPVWDEIDSIIQGLNDDEYEIISNNDEFIESNKNIAAIMQASYMEMMRPIVEGTQKGKDALESHLTLVKRLRKSATAEANKQMANFKEYTEKYSHMTYDDYLKMKKQ